MAAGRILIYGATGYTGRLLAREAARRGLDLVLAGRDPEKLDALADALADETADEIAEGRAAESGAAPTPERSFETRAVALGDAAGLADALDDVAAVLHVAGPFSKTALPMVEACLATGTHYLDVTGEIPVFEALARRDGDAKAAGIALLPGVGFDVVPSDCLAVHVAKRVHDPTILRIGLAGLGGGASRGTARTLIEIVAAGGRVRRGGVLAPQALGTLEHRFEIGAGPIRALAFPAADLASAFHSTGIPNVETYVVASGRIARLLRAAGWLAPILRRRVVQDFLSRRIDRLPEGPDDATREGTRALVLAEVTGAAGERAAAMLETPSGYALTQVAAVEAVRRAAAGAITPGFHTPATAFGPDFVLECSDSVRTDL